MKRKIITSISIFILLFSLAFLLEQKDKREFYVPTEAEEEVVEIIPSEMNVEGNSIKRIKMFKSREYVRIEAP